MKTILRILKQLAFKRAIRAQDRYSKSGKVGNKGVRLWYRQQRLAQRYYKLSDMYRDRGGV